MMLVQASVDDADIQRVTLKRTRKFKDPRLGHFGSQEEVGGNWKLNRRSFVEAGDVTVCGVSSHWTEEQVIF